MKTPTKQKRAEVLTPPRRKVPKEWKKVAGILKGRLTESPVAYQKRIRKEWDKREQQNAKLLSK